MLFSVEKYVTPGGAIHFFADEGLLYVSDGPSGLQIRKNDLITAIDDAAESGEKPVVEIYPNPVSHDPHLVAPSENDVATVRIFNTTGALLYEKELTGVKAGQHIIIPKAVIHALPEGALVWRLNSGVNAYSGKLIKQ